MSDIFMNTPAPMIIQLAEMEASINNANNLIKIADVMLKIEDIQSDNTEKMMEETKYRNDEGMGDIYELLAEIENDKVSKEGTKKLARSTAKFLKSWEDETSYDKAMEVVKK